MIVVALVFDDETVEVCSLVLSAGMKLDTRCDELHGVSPFSGMCPAGPVKEEKKATSFTDMASIVMLLYVLRK